MGGTLDGPAVRPVHGARVYGANGEEARVLRTSRRLGAQGSWEGVWPRSARSPDAEAARRAGAARSATWRRLAQKRFPVSLFERVKLQNFE
jgi:hypothetical protein